MKELFRRLQASSVAILSSRKVLLAVAAAVAVLQGLPADYYVAKAMSWTALAIAVILGIAHEDAGAKSRE